MGKNKTKCHFGLQKVRVHDLVRGEESQEQEEEKEEEGRGEENQVCLCLRIKCIGFLGLW